MPNSNTVLPHILAVACGAGLVIGSKDLIPPTGKPATKPAVKRNQGKAPAVKRNQGKAPTVKRNQGKALAQILTRQRPLTLTKKYAVRRADAEINFLGTDAILLSNPTNAALVEDQRTEDRRTAALAHFRRSLKEEARARLTEEGARKLKKLRRYYVLRALAACCSEGSSAAVIPEKNRKKPFLQEYKNILSTTRNVPPSIDDLLVKSSFDRALNAPKKESKNAPEEVQITPEEERKIAEGVKAANHSAKVVEASLNNVFEARFKAPARK